MTTPTEPPTDKTTLQKREKPLAPWEQPERKMEIIAALRRGDTDGLLAAFAGDPPEDPDERRTWSDRLLRSLAQYVIEARRQNVAILGAADVFVRRTESGTLKQVVAPVTLSIKDKTLFQIPDRTEKRWRSDPNRVWDWKTDSKVSWIMVRLFDDPFKAMVSHEGYLRMNGIAGCSAQNPAFVMVDNEQRANPYVQRNADGDITRIVISTLVAGPAPMTGNIVVVQYTLDMDPRSDLLHMLSGCMEKWEAKKKKGRNEVPPQSDFEADQEADDDADAERDSTRDAAFLISRADFDDFRAELDPAASRRWHWLKLGAGVGIAHNLKSKAVMRAYDQFIKMQEDALRKAITVARRNAMKAHPALSKQTVIINADGNAVVPVVGWTVSDTDVDRYAQALDALARGERTPGIDLIVAAGRYDPSADRVGDKDLDPHDVADTDTDGDSDGDTPPTEADAATQARNAILDELDQIIALPGYPNSAIARLGYPPKPDATVDDLRAMLENARAAAPKRETK